MAAPIYIDPKSFIQWLEENPHIIKNSAEEALWNEPWEYYVVFESLPSLLEKLFELYMDRDKS